MDTVRLLLTNRTGGYCLFGDEPRSRFEGLFFRRNEQIYKTIESLQYSVPAEKVTNKLWCVERQHGNVTEKIVMPAGKDALLIDLSAPLEITLKLDVKQSYDNRVWGRNYEITAHKGCLIFSFSKKNDGRDDNLAFHDEFDCHLAACASPLEYIPIKQWEEHFYSFDNSRGSLPDKRWVYVGAKMRASRLAFGFGMTKEEAIKTARETLARASRLMEEEEKRVSKLTAQRALKHNELEVCRKCCVHALDALSVNDESLYAGLPWFFQFWTRDEIISTRGLMVAGKAALAKKILFRQLDKLRDGKLSTHPTSTLVAADAPGWLFLRLEDLCRFDDHNSLKILVRKERELVEAKLLEYLDNVQRFKLKDGLIVNGPQESWMDTVWENDSRAGARIELQALALANCRFHHYLTGKNHNLEKGLKQMVKQEFVKKNALHDGKGDATVRPNLFIAAYAYPELFSKKEWVNFINNAINKLWLPWGGLATIDKSNPLYTPNYTGENNKSYHRGDSWFWINNIAAIVMHRIDRKLFERSINKMVNASTHELLHLGASGFSAELSSAEQLRSEGCVAQTWSSATLLELLEERYR